MEAQFLIAGFGGQGVLLIGQLLAKAAMHEGMNVSWMPSYGPEMRGGTANCNVILSDREIGSPIVNHPDILMVMNGPSLDKFEKDVVPGGKIFVDSSLVTRKVERTDVEVYYIPASGMAREMGVPTLANMVLLGALVKATGCVTEEGLDAGLMKVIPARKADMLDVNRKMLKAGMDAL